MEIVREAAGAECEDGVGEEVKGVDVKGRGDINIGGGGGGGGLEGVTGGPWGGWRRGARWSWGRSGWRRARWAMGWVEEGEACQVGHGVGGGGGGVPGAEMPTYF